MAVSIPVRRIARLFNPLRKSPWEAPPVTRADVTAAIREKRLAPEPGSSDHAGRIAWMVLNPDANPIEIDVGVPHLGCFVAWPITDGNHRLAAAIYRRDGLISAEVGGDLEYARMLFGVDCQEPDDHDGEQGADA